MVTNEGLRQRRSDGEQTHSSILEAAVMLASVEGIGAISIGRLADAVGVSKSGLYAHFGSKRQLQIEIVHAARDIFQREVIDPAMTAPPGRRRLEALASAYLSYVDRRVFPGGRFFAGMLAEFDAGSGVLHEEVVNDQREWIALVQSQVQEAQAKGEMRDGIDAGQLTFELTAILGQANYYSVLFSGSSVLEHARRAIESLVEGGSAQASTAGG
jgi:AcrR family transcriptional regulator